MATEGDGPDRSDLVVQAGLLAAGNGPTGERMSTRRIASELGISQSTAARYVRECAEAEGFLDVLDRAEGRLAQAARLNEYLGWLRARHLEQGQPAEVIVPVALKVEERLARLAGYDAPTRLQHEPAPGGGAHPDPEIVRKLAEAKEVNARDRARTVEGEIVDDGRAHDGPGADRPG